MHHCASCAENDRRKEERRGRNIREAKKRQSKEQQNSEHRYTEISLSKKRSKTDFLFFGNNRKADDKIYSPTDLLEVGWSTNRPRHDEPVKVISFLLFYLAKNGFLVFLTGLPSSYSKENLEDKLSEMDFTFPKYINLSRKSSFKPFLRHALLGFEIEEDAQGAIKELHKFTFDNSGSEYKLQAALPSFEKRNKASEQIHFPITILPV